MAGEIAGAIGGFVIGFLIGFMLRRHRHVDILFSFKSDEKPSSDD